MKVKELYDHIDALYPSSLSCEWDNDGLMCCLDENAEVTSVLISLDATVDAIMAADANGCNVLLTHHPMIFNAPQRIVASDCVGNRIISAVESQINVLSFHTRLDVGAGGVNDRLVQTLGFTANGLFGDDESPTLGRFFDLPEEMEAASLAMICKQKLGCDNVRVTGKGRVRRICVVGGAGDDFIRPALDIGADVLITGECSYNRAQDAAEEGLIIIEAGHFETEFPVCYRFEEICNDLGLGSIIFDSRSYTFI